MRWPCKVDRCTSSMFHTGNITAMHGALTHVRAGGGAAMAVVVPVSDVPQPPSQASRLRSISSHSFTSALHDLPARVLCCCEGSTAM